MSVEKGLKMYRLRYVSFNRIGYTAHRLNLQYKCDVQGGKGGDIVMHTTFRTKQLYADKFLECARQAECNSPVRPVRFMKVMETNQGCLGVMNGMGVDEEGLERRNPLIVALGDSVTAGHFESLLPTDPLEVRKVVENTMEIISSGDLQRLKNLPPMEVTDARVCYLEIFREKLIDKYELTSVSTINAGIAGDNLIQMSARAYRDVIRYQPDLVLINGSLNWDEAHMGSTDEYKSILKALVQRIKSETKADIVLLTPNGDLPNTMFCNSDAPMPTTGERVVAIREVAEEEQVCLADVYAVWEAAREAGCPWKELLANGINHPGVEGHEVYAMVLMKLLEG